MVSGGLLLRSFWALYKVQPGFNPTRVMSVETSLPNPNDPKTDVYLSASQEAVFLREVLRRNRTIPGVEEVAVSDRGSIPLGHSQIDRAMIPLVREGVEMRANQAPRIDSPIVSPEYFHLLGMPLLKGRLFTDQDVEGAPKVAVINQAAARTYWPNQDPIGKRVRLRPEEDSPTGSAPPNWVTIVGVIADARTESLADSGIPQMYQSIYQAAI